jgi:tetratricopeptide (TPR) repeat protein
LCEPCANRKVFELKKAKEPLIVVRGKDPTMCFKCASDFGNQELPLVAGLSVCEPCRQQIMDFRYPKWLKTAGAVLLVLLALSLYHGRSYFLAGHAFYKAKKLLDSGDARGAVPYFEKALRVAPYSPQVAENAALAYLKIGRVEQAYKAVEGQGFKNDDLFRSVKYEFEQWEKAAASADEAMKLYGDAKYKEAAQKMHAAAATYPALPAFESQALSLDIANAFQTGDYDGMVPLAEAAWKKLPDYDSAASLAGAYACVYASRGEEAARQNAMDMMDKARSLAKSNEEQKDLAEWQPRFDHRIQTRKILSSEQYHALFPSPQQQAEVH